MKELLKLLGDIENDLKNLNTTEQAHAQRQLIFRQYKQAINSGQYPPKNQQQPSPDLKEHPEKQNQSKSKE